MGQFRSVWQVDFRIFKLRQVMDSTRAGAKEAYPKKSLTPPQLDLSHGLSVDNLGPPIWYPQMVSINGG